MCSDCFLGSGSVPVTVLHWQTGSLPTRGHHRSKTVLRRHPSKREPQSQYGQGQGGHQVLHPIQVSHSDRTKLMEKFKSDFNFFFFTILNLLSGPVEAWLSSTGRNGALCGTETGALRESIRLYLWNISCRETALSRCSRPRRKPRNSSRSKHSSWFLTYAQKYVMGCSSGQMRDSDCL